MIPDRLQYFLDDFWNFEKFTKSRPSEPVLLMHYWPIIGQRMALLANEWSN